MITAILDAQVERNAARAKVGHKHPGKKLAPNVSDQIILVIPKLVPNKKTILQIPNIKSYSHFTFTADQVHMSVHTSSDYTVKIAAVAVDTKRIKPKAGS